MESLTILPFAEEHWSAVWSILEPAFRSGETYVYATDITEEEAHRVWIEGPPATFVAVDESNTVVGTYYLKPNQPGIGDHICNCGYVVSEQAQGRGIASKMCAHSQEEAIRRRFRAMQFNLVVSTNTRAVGLWQKLGFRIIGTIPEAYRHARLGFVDAHIMHKALI